VPDIGHRVRRAVLLAVLLPATLLLGDRASAEDTFTLALTWHPGFCETRAAQAECRLGATAGPRLVLHGLWPAWDVNGDGKRDDGDAFCLTGESDREAVMALDRGNWLKLPPVQLPPARARDLRAAMPGSAAGLDRHEWWKHGTCSGLAAEEYFATSIALLHAVERGSLARLLAEEAGSTIGRKQLLDAFEADFGRGSARALVLDCSKADGATALQEIRIRLKRTGIARGLTADRLAIPARAARGDCAAEISIPTWPR